MKYCILLLILIFQYLTTLSQECFRPTDLKVLFNRMNIVGDTILICVKDSFSIKAMPTSNVIDTNGLKYEWMLDNSFVSNSNTINIYTENAKFSRPIFKLIDSIGCVLYNDTLVIKSIEPPKITMLEITNAPVCNENGSISFQVNNPNDELLMKYTLNDEDPKTITGENTIISDIEVGNHNLKMFYNEIQDCVYVTKFSISFEDAISIDFELPKKDYCVGDRLILNPDLDDRINYEYWYLNGKLKDYDGLDFTLNNSHVGELEIKWVYEYDDFNCTNEFVDSITVHPTPKPQIIPNLHDSDICPSENQIFIVDGIFSEYKWNLNGEITTNNFLAFNPSQSENITYSIAVKDDYGCMGSDKDSVTILSGIDVIIPNIPADSICKGTKVLYFNDNNLQFNNEYSTNKIYENDALKIVEWEVSGSIFDQNNTTECYKVDVSFDSGKNAPNGKIQPFGTSNTLVFADADNSANYLLYQWFFIDLNKGTEFIYNKMLNATERIIDCTNFDCLFAFSEENSYKVLGLEIYNFQNGCTNLIFYDKHNLFPGLKDIPVGISDIPNRQQFIVYPNVNSGSFFIKLLSSQKAQHHIVIYNLLGELILLEKFTNQGFQPIYLPNIEAGIYFVILNQDNRAVAKQKLIIH